MNQYVAGYLNIRASMVTPTSRGTVLSPWAKAHLPHLWLVALAEDRRVGVATRWGFHTPLPAAPPVLSIWPWRYPASQQPHPPLQHISGTAWFHLPFISLRYPIVLGVFVTPLIFLSGCGVPPKIHTHFLSFSQIWKRWVRSVYSAALLIHSLVINFKLLTDGYKMGTSCGHCFHILETMTKWWIWGLTLNEVWEEWTLMVV